MELKSVLVMFLFLFIATSSAYTPYQYLMHVQFWPAAICKSFVKPQCFNSKMLPPRFTIHGLWPTNRSMSSLNCTGDAFDVNGMGDELITKLLETWPDVAKGQHVKLWQGEYDKHGKCSDNVFPKTEYFRKTEEMYRKFDIAQILQKAQIVAQPLQSNMTLYSIDQITRAIQSETGGHLVNIKCFKQKQKQKENNKKTKKNNKNNNNNNNNNNNKPLIYLGQVVLCYDEYGRNRIDCDPTRTTGCKFIDSDQETIPSIAHIRLS